MLEEVQDSLSYQDKTTEEVQETLNDQRKAILDVSETLKDQSEAIQEIRSAALDQSTSTKSLEARFARIEASIERQYDVLFQLLALKDSMAKRGFYDSREYKAPSSWIPRTVAESCEEEHAKHFDHLCGICRIGEYLGRPQDSIRDWERDTREKLERAKIGRTLWTSVAVTAFKGDALRWWQRMTKESRECTWENLIAALNKQFPYEAQKEAQKERDLFLRKMEVIRIELEKLRQTSIQTSLLRQ